MDEYQVNLPVFEGPLDLLLHLVTKSRIDIHDIPIHLITDQYLEYLAVAERFNLELGSSFFTMASTLLLIKSRMLLPKRRQEEADETEDPRAELSRSLEEFRRMKEVKARIENLLEEERPFRRKEPENVKGGIFTGRISMARLKAAFLSLYDAIEAAEERTMEPEAVSVEGEMETLARTLARGAVGFRSYFLGMKTRLRLAAAFMALLEMIRLGKAQVVERVGGLEIEGMSL